MADSNWDNGGQVPEKRGWPTWAKILAGCGCGCLGLSVLLVGSCVGLGRWVSKNPEAFERKVKGFVENMARPDYDLLRRTVDQLRTEAGAKAVYAANPDLKETFGSEADFLKRVAEWRPRLEPIPEAFPDLDSSALDYQNNMGSKRIGYRYESGWMVRLHLSGNRISDIVVKESPRRVRRGRRGADPEPDSPTPKEAP